MKPLPTSLLPRLLSTLVLWGVIIASVVMHSEIGFCLLIAAAALGSLWEYFWLLKVGGIPRHWHLGYTAGIILLLGNFWLLRYVPFGGPLASGGGLIFAFDGLVLATALIALFLRTFAITEPKRSSAEGIAFTLLGMIYIPWCFSFVAKILFLAPLQPNGILPGATYVLFLLTVTKFTDVGAFACGSLFGKHSFCANISPHKTWEGLLGALVLAVLCGLGFFSFFKQELSLLTLPSVLLISLLLGVTAIAGDLAESLLKRALHTKDSSDTLPGIGGGLDLIDSILFTAPLFYFILQFLIWTK